MNIKVQSVGFKADPIFENMIIDFFEDMQKKYPRIDSCLVTLRRQNVESKLNELIELKMILPGGTIFSSERSDSFEVSWKKISQNLRRRFKKYQGRFDKNKREKMSV
ncbi:MAG: HPF/RaiA family ribosome-associated protein [Bacteroidota bacterium]